MNDERILLLACLCRLYDYSIIKVFFFYTPTVCINSTKSITGFKNLGDQKTMQYDWSKSNPIYQEPEFCYIHKRHQKSVTNIKLSFRPSVAKITEEIL